VPEAGVIDRAKPRPATAAVSTTMSARSCWRAPPPPHRPRAGPIWPGPPSERR